MSLVVEKVLNGRLFEICYFAHSDESLNTICVDPGYDTKRILDYIESKNLIVTDILLTHGHFDHMLSCKVLQDRFNSNVYISNTDEKILYEPEHNYANLINKTDFDRIDIKKNIYDSETIVINGFAIKCLSTPGHTEGSFCYYFEDDKVLFSGDTLFFKTYGRCDLYTGDINKIKESINNKLFKLPDDTIVYPGHGNSTYISDEKINNEILVM